MNEFELRQMANESICFERMASAKTEREAQWWMREASRLMSESEAVKRQPEQQPVSAPGGCVSAPEVQKPLEEPAVEAPYMNGRCCK